MEQEAMMNALGKMLRAARKQKTQSLRALAREINISASYLSDIELGRRVPSDIVLETLAGALSVPFDDLVQFTGRLDDTTKDYLMTHPTAILLLRTMAATGLSERELQRLINEFDRRVDRIRD